MNQRNEKETSTAKDISFHSPVPSGSLLRLSGSCFMEIVFLISFLFSSVFLLFCVRLSGQCFMAIGSMIIKEEHTYGENKKEMGGREESNEDG